MQKKSQGSSTCLCNKDIKSVITIGCLELLLRKSGL